MSKRKAAAATEDVHPKDQKMRDDDESSSDESDTEMVNVDFEWFDPQPAVDFHGLKTLLRQLLDADATLFDLSALADLILSQPLLGSTVKVDGNETDPYAFLTVINLSTHSARPEVAALTSYLARQAAKVPALAAAGLPELLQQQSGSASTKPQVGLILTERFINMPAEIITPCYTMLLEEIDWALAEKEPYDFTHYLVLSKAYTEVESKLDAQESRPGKKSKKEKVPETFYFHAEDEKLHEFAAGFGNFDYETEQDEGAADAKRAFQEAGIRPVGHMSLIEAGQFRPAIKGIGEFLSG